MAGLGGAKTTAVLLVSAWQEGEPAVVAARITYTHDATQPDRLTVTAAGVEAIVGVVRRWLEDVEALGRSGDARVTEE